MSDDKQSVPGWIRQDHEVYCGWNQEEAAGSMFLAANGHPDAAEYRRLRSLYDSLSYAANAGMRYVAYGDNHDNLIWSAPELELQWGNSGVYPAMGDRYYAWLRHHAETGFADQSAPPRLDRGSLIFEVADNHMPVMAAIQQAAADRGLKSPRRINDAGNHVFRIDPRTEADVVTMFEAVRPHWTFLPTGHFTVPELPLSRKTFMFGNVDAITETPRHVLAPTLALKSGPEAAVYAAHVDALIEQMLGKVRRGFPKKQAREWLLPAAALSTSRKNVDRLLWEATTANHVSTEAPVP